METKFSLPAFVRPPKPEELESLAALQDNPNFKVIIQWLLNSAGDADDKLRKMTNPPDVYRAQSATNNISSIVYYAGIAREIINKTKVKESGKAALSRKDVPERALP